MSGHEIDALEPLCSASDSRRARVRSSCIASDRGWLSAWAHAIGRRTAASDLNLAVGAWLSSRWDRAVEVERGGHVARIQQPDASTGRSGRSSSESGSLTVCPVKGYNGSICLGLYK